MGLNGTLGRGAEPAIVVDVGRGLAVGILAHPDRADVLVVPGLHPEDLAELARADDLDGLLEMRRRALLGADGHDLVGLAGRADHRLALGDVVRDRLLDIDVLAGQHGLDRGQGVPVVGRGDDDAVDVFAVEHGAVVARRVAACFPSAFLTRSAVSPAWRSSTSAIGDDLDVGLRQERVEKLFPRLPAPMIPSRIFSFAAPALPIAGVPKTEAAPAVTPTAPTNPRLVNSSLDMIVTFSGIAISCPAHCTWALGRK